MPGVIAITRAENIIMLLENMCGEYCWSTFADLKGVSAEGAIPNRFMKYHICFGWVADNQTFQFRLREKVEQVDSGREKFPVFPMSNGAIAN